MELMNGRELEIYLGGKLLAFLQRDLWGSLL